MPGKMSRTNGLNIEEQVRAALTYVQPDLERLVQLQAMEHAVANMGGDLEDLCRNLGGGSPQNLVQDVYRCFLEVAAGGPGDDGDGLEYERRYWISEARKSALAVQAAGLPLTLENTRHAFERTGPFARRT